MPASKGGRTLQDCYDSLGNAVKRKHPGEQLSSAKRLCVLEEQLPVLIAARRAVKNGDNKVKEESTETMESEGSAVKPDEVTVDFIKYLEEQKTLVQQEVERLEEKRRAFFSKQSDLVGVYMYGLEKISKLTDVRDAPDAILPGNQV